MGSLANIVRTSAQQQVKGTSARSVDEICRLYKTLREREAARTSDHFQWSIYRDLKLSNRELRALVARAQKGSEIANEATIMNMVPLIRKYAWRYYKAADMDIEDLYQQGILGVKWAIEKFDATRSHAFYTTAEHWIRRRCQDAVQKYQLVRTPQSVHDVLPRIRSAYQALSEQENGKPGLDRIRACLSKDGYKMPTEKLLRQAYEHAEQRMILFLEHEYEFPVQAVLSDGQWNSGSTYSRLNDLDADIDGHGFTEDDLMAAETRTELNEALSALPEDRREALTYVFGLDGEEPISVTAAAARMGVRRTTLTGQIETAKKMIRPKLKELGHDLALHNMRPIRLPDELAKTQLPE